jgi:hypothetical protein
MASVLGWFVYGLGASIAPGIFGDDAVQRGRGKVRVGTEEDFRADEKKFAADERRIEASLRRGGERRRERRGAKVAVTAHSTTPDSREELETEELEKSTPR